MSERTRTAPANHGSRPPQPTRRIGRRGPAWLRPVLVAAALITVFGVLTWLVAFSSVLDVRSIDVRGARLLDADAVRAVAAVPLGQPLARIDLDAIRDRIGELPEAEAVEVRRTWPHTVTIAITERTAVAVLDDGSGYRLLDRTGVAYHPVDRVPDGLLPVRVPDDRALRRAVVAVAAALPKQLVERTEYLHAGTRDSIILQLDGGVRVMWGSTEDSATKAKVLLALMQTEDAEDVTVYDVRVPERPTTTT